MSNLQFNEWMRVLDLRIQNTMGVSVYDLPDKPFRDWFTDGLSAREAAKIIINEEWI